MATTWGNATKGAAKKIQRKCSFVTFRQEIQAIQLASRSARTRLQLMFSTVTISVAVLKQNLFVGMALLKRPVASNAMTVEKAPIATPTVHCLFVAMASSTRVHK